MYELYKRIREICDKKGISDSQLCTAIGSSASLMSDLKNERKKSVSVDRIMAIAEFLDVSIDWLLTGIERQPTQSDELSDDVLSADEWKLIAAYRDLNGQGKQEMQKYAALLRGAGIYKNDSQSRLVAGE